VRAIPHEFEGLKDDHDPDVVTSELRCVPDFPGLPSAGLGAPISCTSPAVGVAAVLQSCMVLVWAGADLHLHNVTHRHTRSHTERAAVL